MSGPLQNSLLNKYATGKSKQKGCVYKFGVTSSFNYTLVHDTKCRKLFKNGHGKNEKLQKNVRSIEKDCTTSIATGQSKQKEGRVYKSGVT